MLMVYEAGASEGTSMHMPLSEIAPEEPGKIEGRALVFHDDGGLQLSGVLHQLKTS